MSPPLIDPLLTLLAAATVFAVMLVLGLGIVPREFRWVFERPGLLVKGLVAVLVAVPALAVGVMSVVELPRGVEVGIVLMAISPGAPVALRRSLGAGGHRSFAPALQILVALLAVVSMPLSVAAMDRLYGLEATIHPAALARQVFVAQLLPMGIGMAVRRVAPALAGRLEPRLARVAGWLLVGLVIAVLIDIWKVVVDAGSGVAAAIALLTLLALAAGHLLGGPEPGTRTAVAICSAARNPGLAMLVATLNDAPPAVIATVLAYLIVSAFTVVPYAVWRKRVGAIPRRA